MAATPLTDVAQRLLANVERDAGDLAEGIVRVPVERYRDPLQWQREIDEIFLKVPMVSCMSVDIPNAGDRSAWTLAGRPVVTIRGDDGVARSFLNTCRHRGANLVCDGFGHGRRVSCPYHAWVYDAQGSLVAVPQKETFGEFDVSALIELTTVERHGLVFCVVTPGLPLDLDAWLGDMGSALDNLQLDQLHRHEVTTHLVSGNWKATADGYLDGYHIGYLHRNNIGLKAINNRNTFDLYGPHVRLGFANKPIVGMKDLPIAEWDLPQAMSLVHYIFPNISISGQPGRRTMMSRMIPGPTVDRCSVQQYQYSRTPIDTDEYRAELEADRILYAGITGDEDFATVIGITDSMPAMAAESFMFGRNESGNQNLHRWVERLTSPAVPVTVG